MQISIRLLILSLVVFEMTGLAQPTVMFQPQSQSVSPGAQVGFIVVAYASDPISYAWYKDGTLLHQETNDLLILNDVTQQNAGDYTVVMTSLGGTLTSDIAVLSVDPTFRKVRSVPMVTNGGSSTGANWVDYDQDGDLDIFVCRRGIEPNQLFANQGNGNFSQVSGSGVTEFYYSLSSTWADYDNDGFPDLFVGNFGADLLYRNNADGTFTRITDTPVVTNTSPTYTAAWADYDRDGFLDLFTGNYLEASALFRNNGLGAFIRTTTGPIATEAGRYTYSSAWGDYNNDGWLDLLVANAVFNANEILYRNDSLGNFVRFAGGPPSTSGGDSYSCSWADYDNDLDLDVFVANSAGQNNALYRNNGNGSFSQIVLGEVVADGGNSEAAAWGDYDNDGFLDLYVANNNGQQNFLYHNNKDGTLSRVLSGSPSTDLGNSVAAAWGDYDDDGFLDLFVSHLSGNNALYRNNGNSNSWMVVRCNGRVSNRSALGAKVKVLATIFGRPVWQMRELGARDVRGSPCTPFAEFGLGDALTADAIRIEWPSGLVQNLENVSARQFLVVIEPPSVGISSMSVLEGDAASKSVQLVAYLTAATNAAVSVEFFTSNGSGTAGVDYIGTNGVLTFEAGTTSVVFELEVLGDLLDETNRSFFVNLTNAQPLGITRPRAEITLIDDDPLILSISDVTVIEGDVGFTNVPVLISLQKAVDVPVSVDFASTSATGTAGRDYVPTNGTLIFDPGATQMIIQVSVMGDVIDELNEIVIVTLSNSVNVALTDLQGTCTIVDDDPVPSVSIGDVVIHEGNSGTNHAVFPLTLSQASGRNVSVIYATSNQTAVAGLDYLPRASQLIFQPGVTNLLGFAVVNGDRLLESNEVFTVRLSNTNNAVVGKGIGSVTIVDDDFLIAPYGASHDGALAFMSFNGRSYRVEWTDNLDEVTSWEPLSGAEDLTGTGGLIEVIDPDGRRHPQRFYRIVLLDERL